MTARSMQSALQSALDAMPTRRAGASVGPDGLLVCERCGTPRQVRLTGPDGVERVLPCMCRCMVEARDAEDAAAEAERRDADLRRRVGRAFPNPAMRERTFAADDGGFGAEQMGTCRRYASRLAELGTGLRYGLLLFGPPDSGKTFMACCVANVALDAGLSVVVRSTAQLLADRDECPMSRLLGCDLLVLDDLGAERNTSYGQELIYAVVDGRCSARKPTVITTNLTREGLSSPADVAAARIYGRALEWCYPVEVRTGRRRATRERYAEMRADLEKGSE